MPVNIGSKFGFKSIIFFTKMEIVRKYLEGKQTVDIYFPPEEIESWRILKEKHSNLGYYWCDFSIDQTLSKARKLDKKNMRK